MGGSRKDWRRFVCIRADITNELSNPITLTAVDERGTKKSAATTGNNLEEVAGQLVDHASSYTASSFIPTPPQQQQPPPKKNYFDKERETGTFHRRVPELIYAQKLHETVGPEKSGHKYPERNGYQDPRRKEQPPYHCHQENDMRTMPPTRHSGSTKGSEREVRGGSSSTHHPKGPTVGYVADSGCESPMQVLEVSTTLLCKLPLLSIFACPPHTLPSSQHGNYNTSTRPRPDPQHCSYDVNNPNNNTPHQWVPREPKVGWCWTRDKCRALYRFFCEKCHRNGYSTNDDASKLKDEEMQYSSSSSSDTDSHMIDDEDN